jgi:hypothetical protein
MSKFGKSIVVIGWVLALASCATPDANRAGTQRAQPGVVMANPADPGGGGGAGGGGY